MEKDTKKIKFISLLIGILIFCWCFSIYWVTGKVNFFEISKPYSIDFQNRSEISYKTKDLQELGNNEFVSLTDDSYFIITFPESTEIKDIVLDISLENETEKCKVFYATINNDFSKKNSVGKIIRSGKNIFQINGEKYKKIRIDITNKKDVKFKVNSISLYRNYIPIDVVWVFIICSLFSIGWLFFYFFSSSIKNKRIKNIILKWNYISIRKKKLIGLVVFTGMTLSIVFLKLYYSNMIFAYSDIGSDTKMQYIPQYNLIMKKISDGTLSTWLPEVGYGYNIAYFFMCDPLLLLALLFGSVFGTSSIPAIIVIYKSIGIFLCTIVAFKFLEFFSDNYDVIAIGSYLYAFNGFTLVWGQHYLFFDYPLYTILVFYFIERHLRTPGKKFDLSIIIISFASMAYSVYMSYMIYLPCCLYAVIRYIQLNDKFKWKEFFSSMLQLVINIFIGFIGGLSIGLYYIKNILNSGRVVSDTSIVEQFVDGLKSFYLQEDFWGSLQRFLSANLSGIGSSHEGLHNYYEEPQLFFSALFWIIFFQFICTIHKTNSSKKQVLCKIIAVILVGLAIYNKGILLALYAFSQETRRTTFALFPVISIMIVEVLNNIFQKKILSKLGVLLGVMVTVYLMLYNWDQFFSTEKMILIVISLSIVLISIIIFFYVCFEKNLSEIRGYVLILTFVLFINVCAEMYISVNRVGLVKEDWLFDSEIKTDTQKAVDYIKNLDETYFRMDKNYTTWNGLTDAYFEEYYPVTTYNSCMSHYTKEYNQLFMNPLYISIREYKPSFAMSPNDIVQYSSLGLKYIMSKYPLSDYKFYELIKQIDNVYIYKNLEAESFTTFFDDVILKSEFEKLGYNDKNKLQQKALVIEDEDFEKFSDKVKPVQQVLDEYKEINITKDVVVNEKDINQFLDKNIDMDVEFTFSNHWNDMVTGIPFLELDIIPMTHGTIKIYYDTGNGFNETECDSIHCDTVESQIRYVLPRNTEKIKLMFSSVSSKLIELKIMDSLEEIKNSDNQSILYEGENSSQIKGNITCDREGILYIPLPYDKNWNVKIDGEKVEPFLANAGFLAINISTGEHRIEIEYDSIEIKVGFLCIIMAIIMAWLYYFLCEINVKKKIFNQKMDKNISIGGKND